jgi:hypothetical protein
MYVGPYVGSFYIDALVVVLIKCYALVFAST